MRKLSSSPTPTKLGALSSVRPATRISIRDVWVGYNVECPFISLYELQRGSRDAFEGEGRFSKKQRMPTHVPLNVTATAMNTFLEALDELDLVPGEYEPYCSHTDDYPELEILVDVPLVTLGRRGGFVLFHTTSQGKFRSPAACFVNGTAYIVYGESLVRALAGLELPRGARENAET